MLQLLLDKRNRSNLPIGTPVPVTVSTRTFSLNLQILFLVSCCPSGTGREDTSAQQDTATKKRKCNKKTKQITGVQTRTYSTKTKNNFAFRSRRPKVVEGQETSIAENGALDDCLLVRPLDSSKPPQLVNLGNFFKFLASGLSTDLWQTGMEKGGGPLQTSLQNSIS